jgi:hypothetical protein
MVGGCRAAQLEPAKTGAGEPLGPVEGFPAARLVSVAARDAQVGHLRLGKGFAPMFVLAVAKRWTPGATVTVAIRGGDEALHRQIAQVAALWTSHGNIGFDFGYVPGRGYRTWSAADVEYAAQIRIGFDEPGYFSCIGNDSVSRDCAAPQQSSMNFSGFDRWRPPEWQPIVLHAFGHALGLEHEQWAPNAQCDAELRWEDDAGYTRTVDVHGQPAPDEQGRRPGIYSVLNGPPQHWSRETVDFNLRHLVRCHACEPQAHDEQSIMRYEFAPWMLVREWSGRCFRPRVDDLSALDHERLARLYPREPLEVASVVRQQLAAIVALRDADGVPSSVRHTMQARLDVLHRLTRVP